MGSIHDGEEGNCCSALRDEFRLANFLFRKAPKDSLTKCLWVADRQRQVAGVYMFLAYRTIAAAYAFAVLLSDYIQNPFFNASNGVEHFTLAYLTQWTYLVLTCYLITAAIVSWAGYFCCGAAKVEPTLDSTNKREMQVEEGATAAKREEETDLHPVPIGFQFYWALHQVAKSGAVLVTILYFSLLYSGGPLSFYNLALHLVNSLLVLADEFAGSATPIKLLHFVWTVAYGLAYILFTIFYQLADGERVVYTNVLDLRQPASFALYAVGSLVATIPVQIIVFVIYRVRLCMKARCCSM